MRKYKAKAKDKKKVRILPIIALIMGIVATIYAALNVYAVAKLSKYYAHPYFK